MKDYIVIIGSALGRFVNRAEQIWCRHDFVPANEKGRMFLRCSKCQAETPGWDTSDVPPPVKLFSGDPMRFRVR